MESPTQGSSTHDPDYVRKKRNCLTFLLIWAVASGAIYGMVTVDWEKPLLFLDMIVFVLATIKWTHLDAAQHGYSLWRYFIPFMVICPGPLFVMPVYFVRSRGWSSGIIASLLALGFLIMQVAVDNASSYLAFEFFWGD